MSSDFTRMAKHLAQWFSHQGSFTNETIHYAKDDIADAYRWGHISNAEAEKLRHFLKQPKDLMTYVRRAKKFKALKKKARRRRPRHRKAGR